MDIEQKSLPWGKRAVQFLFGPYRASEKYVASADILRVLCIFLVAWYHIWQQSWLYPMLKIGSWQVSFDPLVRAGYMPVDIMLMLSGFLLFLPYARAHMDHAPMPRVGEFYKKRAARILPSYLICIFIIFFCFALPKGEYSSPKEMWLDLITHLTFTQTFFYSSYYGTHLNAVLWTVAVEVQFYLIAPLVCRAFAKQPALTYIALVAAAFCWRFLYAWNLPDDTLYFNQLPAMLDVYANGMAFSYLYVYLCRRMKPHWLKSLLFSAVAVACVVGIVRIIATQSRTSGDIPAIHDGQMYWRFPLTFLSALLVVSLGHGLNGLVRLVSIKPVRWLSFISYNVYIWHSYAALRLKEWHIPPYVAELPNQVGEMPWQRQYTYLCFAVAIVLAAIMTYLTELPRHWSRHYGRHAG